MQLIHNFNTSVFEDGEDAGKEMAEIMIDINTSRSHLDTYRRDTTGNQERVRELWLKDFDREWVDKIHNHVGTWLDSEREPSVSVELGDVGLEMDDEVGEFHVSVNSRGIWYIVHTDDASYEARIPAGTVKEDNEYLNFEHLEQFHELFGDFLLMEKSEQTSIGTSTSNNPHSILRNIFDNFHQSTKPLRNRHQDKERFEIEDERDVQDILESHLKIAFNDVRAEEPTPSKSGAGSQIDFLLKSEKIGIEVKFSKSVKVIGDELSVDKERYKSHPDCKILHCFIYDPEYEIRNPAELEDLEQDGDFPVIVSVCPT